MEGCWADLPPVEGFEDLGGCVDESLFLFSSLTPSSFLDFPAGEESSVTVADLAQWFPRAAWRRGALPARRWAHRDATGRSPRSCLTSCAQCPLRLPVPSLHEGPAPHLESQRPGHKEPLYLSPSWSGLGRGIESWLRTRGWPGLRTCRPSPHCAPSCCLTWHWTPRRRYLRSGTYTHKPVCTHEPWEYKHGPGLEALGEFLCLLLQLPFLRNTYPPT